MKNLFYSFATLLATTYALQATVYTVSNHPLGGAQFSNLKAAYDSASSGDTLYLEGTNIPYTYSTVYTYQGFNKQLTLVGTGFNPNVFPAKRTIISRLGAYSSEANFFSGSSGSSFFGITFSERVQIQSSGISLIFEDCSFSEFVDFTGNITGQLTFRNCVFTDNNSTNISLPNSAAVTILLFNSVLNGSIEGSNNSNSTVLIDHCVFLLGQISVGVFRSLRNADISNSIVMNTTAIVSHGSIGNTFTNNIVATAATMPPAGQSGSGNFTSTDPMFVNYTPGQFYSTSHDYALQSGSPGINAGSDSTDIGPHGGGTFFSEQGEVLWTPYLRSAVIQNSSVAPNGTIQVQVKASVPATD